MIAKFVILGFCGGIFSILYFFLLFVSIRQLTKQSRPFLLMITGFLPRLFLMGLAAYFVVTRYQIEGLLSFCFGFFLVKYILQYRVKKVGYKS